MVGPASDETYRVHVVLIGMRPPTTSPSYCYDAKPEANPQLSIPTKYKQLECIVSPEHSCIVHQRIAMNRRCSHPKHHPPDLPDKHTLDGSTRVCLIRCTPRATHGRRRVCRCVCASSSFSGVDTIQCQNTDTNLPKTIISQYFPELSIVVKSNCGNSASFFFGEFE